MKKKTGLDKSECWLLVCSNCSVRVGYVETEEAALGVPEIYCENCVE